MTAAHLRASLRARVTASTWHGTADALGVSLTTLMRAVAHGQITAALLQALRLERVYQNGKGRPVNDEALRGRAARVLAHYGTHRAAQDALGRAAYARIQRFAEGRRPPTARAVQSLGYTAVYVAKK